MEVQGLARALSIDEHLQSQNLRRLRSMRKRWRPESEVVDAARNLFDRVRSGLGSAARRGAHGYCRWFKGEDERISDTITRAIPEAKTVWKDTDDRRLHKLEYRRASNPEDRNFERVNEEQFQKWMHSIDPMAGEDLNFPMHQPSRQQLDAFVEDIRSLGNADKQMAALPGPKPDTETREMLKFVAREDATIQAAMSIVDTIESRVQSETSAGVAGGAPAESVAEDSAQAYSVVPPANVGA